MSDDQNKNPNEDNPEVSGGQDQASDQNTYMDDNIAPGDHLDHDDPVAVKDEHLSDSDLDLEPLENDFDEGEILDDVSEHEEFDLAEAGFDEEYDESFDDLDQFTDDWEENGFDDTEQAGQKSGGIAALGGLSGLFAKPAVKYGAIGLGGVVSVAVLYVFVLGGTAPGLNAPAPQPVAQNQSSQGNSSAGANSGVQAALNASQSSGQDAAPVSLFENLENLPQPDAVPGAPVITKDGEDLGDVFSIMEEELPSLDQPQAPANGSGASTPQQVQNNNSGSGALGEMDDFSLPMPTPIMSGADDTSSKDVAVQASNNSVTSDEGNGFEFFEEETADNNTNDFAVPQPVANNDSDPLSDFVPVEEEPAIAEGPTPLPTAPSSNDTQMASAQGADLSALQNQLSRLNNRMDEMNNRISDLERGRSSGSANVDLSRIETAIERLERRIDSMASTSSQQIAAVNPPSSSASATKSAPVQKASAPASPAPKKATRKSSPPAARNWELRGASPDQAFIAKKRGGTLQTVRVGDRVAGLGTIRFIGLEKGSWVVKSSGGTIRQ